MEPSANCLNCDNPLSYADKFCPNCGQKAATHRLTLHDLLHDVIHYFTHADKGIFHLLRALSTHPGLVARAYVEGARKKYFNPINFLLIVAGIVLFMTAVFHINSNETENRRPQNTQASTQTAAPTPEQIKHYREIGVRGQKVNKFFTKYANLVTIGATPLFAFLFFLFYRNNKFNYTEHLIANMYFVGFIMIFYALLFIPLRSILGVASLYAFFAFEGSYRALAYYQFIGKRGTWQVVKAFLISFFLSGLWIAGTSYFVRVYIQTGFGIS
jgi:uncharacterized protein DUF3667